MIDPVILGCAQFADTIESKGLFVGCGLVRENVGSFLFGLDLVKTDAFVFYLN